MTDEYQIDNVTWAEKDGNGNIVVDTDSVNTDEVSSAKSHRQGRVVYYNPADSGPYTDGQDALSDVPTGGKFVLAAGTDYDVATEGRLARTEPCTITGEGVAEVATTSPAGSRIINSGGDVVNSPVIEFSASGSRDGATVSNLTILHTGNSPAVLFDNHIRTSVDNVYANGDESGAVGLKYEQDGFFSTVSNSHFLDFTDRAGLVTGTGYAHTFTNCFFRGDQSTSGSIALETQRPQTVVVGGQLSANDSGLKYNNQSGGQLYGGMAYGVTAEGIDIGFEITGSSGWQNVILQNVTTRSITGRDVIFDNCNGATLYNPARFLGTGIEWTANSIACGVIGPRASVGGEPKIVDASATGAYQFITSHEKNGAIGIIDVDSNLTTKVSYAIDENAPAWHDGTDWYSSSGTTFSP